MQITCCPESAAHRPPTEILRIGKVSEVGLTWLARGWQPRQRLRATSSTSGDCHESCSREFRSHVSGPCVVCEVVRLATSLTFLFDSFTHSNFHAYRRHSRNLRSSQRERIQRARQFFRAHCFSGCCFQRCSSQRKTGGWRGLQLDRPLCATWITS